MKQKNVFIMIVDALGYNLGMSFLSPQTILPMFVALISGSQILIGTLVAVQSFGQLIPQIFAANWIEQLPRKRGYVVALGFFGERLPFLILVFIVFFVPSRMTVLLVFFICFGLSYTAAGFNMPAFLGLFADAIPEKARGKVMGYGTAVGLVMSAAGAYLAKRLLDTLTGLSGYGFCFLIGFGVLAVSLIPLTATEESIKPPGSKKRTMAEFFREIAGIFKGNVYFRRYLSLQALIQLPYASIAFITGYAVLSLGAAQGTVALSTAVFMTANALGSVLFGFLGDRYGYRLIYILGCGTAVLFALIMIFSPGLVFVFIAFGLSGLFMGCYLVGGNMAMEFDHVHRVSTFTALSFSAAAPVRILLPLAAGILAEKLGSSLLFTVTAVVSAGALLFSAFLLKDPRHSKTEKAAI